MHAIITFILIIGGGEKQRIAIARAIVNDPEIIFAEEPTGNLDSNTSKEIMELLCKMNEEGKTIIIVTHDPIVASYCKRKIIIADGKIVNNFLYDEAGSKPVHIL